MFNGFYNENVISSGNEERYVIYYPHNDFINLEILSFTLVPSDPVVDSAMVTTEHYTESRTTYSRPSQPPPKAVPHTGGSAGHRAQHESEYYEQQPPPYHPGYTQPAYGSYPQQGYQQPIYVQQQPPVHGNETCLQACLNAFLTLLCVAATCFALGAIV